MKPTRASTPKIRSLMAALMSVLMVTGLLSAATSPAAEAQGEPLPIVFVHGFSGSGAQFESQAMRFASNGWPADRIKVFEHDTGGGDGQTPDALDGFIDDVLAEFGVDQVHTVGHSMGTAVMSGYLGDDSQAAKVATYTSVDGLPAACSNGPECQSITAASMGQTHVEAVVSAEAFARMYEFITGEPPATTDIEPEGDEIEIAGRAVNFPTNTGPDGATLELWEIDPATGHRVGDSPLESTTLAGGPTGGEWGPWQVEAGQRYELALTRDDTTIHFYKQPWIRSDYIVRLNATETDSELAQNTNRGPDHTTITLVRYREWWTTHESGDNDIVGIFTKDSSGQVVEEPVSVLENIDTNNLAAVHIHDGADSPQDSTLEILPWFASQAFQTGVDVYMPAEPDAGGTITLVNGARGQYDMADWQILNAPNWPSDGHHVSFELNDFVQ